MAPTEIDGRFWLRVDGSSLAGSGRIELLEQIQATGSISAAARAMGMSYKAAWDAVDAMNNLVDEPLVVRQAGGAHGGGTALTEQGRNLVRHYRAAEQEHRLFLKRMGESLAQLDLPDSD